MSRGRILLATLAGGMALLVVAVPRVAAQEADARLSGRLVSADGGDPVDGALVRLLDEESEPVTAVLSGEDGGFAFDAVAPGSYRVRVLRLGFGEWTSDPVRLEPGTWIRRIFRIPVRPVELPGLRAEAEGPCPTDPDEARRALDLYLEARPALRAIAELEASGRYHFLVELVNPTYEGIYGRTRIHVRRDTSVARVPRPIASLSPEELLRGGYARPDTAARTSARYFAPDARALASDEFLASHCLELAEPAGGDSVGVGFFPLPDRTVVDVEGVLWLDAGTRRPLSVAYGYTGLEEFLEDWALPYLRAHYREKYRDHPEVRVRYSRIEVRDHEELGGRIAFRDVGAGAPVTVSWIQRVPVLRHYGWFGADIGAEVHPTAQGWEHTCRVLALVPAENGEAEPATPHPPGDRWKSGVRRGSTVPIPVSGRTTTAS